MFTGIIEEVGTLKNIRSHGDGLALEIECPRIAPVVRPGESVAVNGICLTASAEARGPVLKFDAVAETAGRTTLRAWKAGRPLNLEQALTLQSRLGGHIVLGHVDGTAEMIRRDERDTGIEMLFRFGPDYARYIVSKGSVCIDGVSLTIAAVEPDQFRVALIPFTLEGTNLDRLTPGQTVNIETDIMARYAESLLADGEKPQGLSLDKLKQAGFTRPSGG
ncbi:riboflavin synthase [Planctomycetota bacterium]